MLFKRKAPNERVNGASIVLLGSFNPCMFQPQWFVSQNLLPKSEGDKADAKVISPDVSQFDTAAEAIAEFSSADDPLGWQSRYTSSNRGTRDSQGSAIVADHRLAILPKGTGGTLTRWIIN